MAGSPLTRASAWTNWPARLLYSDLATASSRFFWPEATGTTDSMSPNISLTSFSPVTVPPWVPYSSPFLAGPVMFSILAGSQPEVVTFDTWSKVFTSWMKRPMFSFQVSLAAGLSPSLGFLKSNFLSSTYTRKPARAARCMRKS